MITESMIKNNLKAVFLSARIKLRNYVLVLADCYQNRANRSTQAFTKISSVEIRFPYFATCSHKFRFLSSTIQDEKNIIKPYAYFKINQINNILKLENHSKFY
ncbi:hypothetical protein BpHYR1_017188 [Brachionus plicatilis]|uniref:Uncharacterized protein n=1 Tax=Brachionus plicatilis TaxID=10195 RepID=A0A3M7QJU7_BRAPC|nr:hypothetical protein BpHYR1_017188 [Brachionus plicatilis]